MCVQCMTEARHVECPLPGFFLAQATKPYHGVEVGQWMLGRCNDPDIVFTEAPMPDPTEGIDDGQMNGMDLETGRAYQRFLKRVDTLQADFVIPVEVGFEIYEAASRVGYNPILHGSNIVYWLTNLLGKACETATPAVPMAVPTLDHVQENITFDDAGRHNKNPEDAQ